MVGSLANRTDLELALWAPLGNVPMTVARANTLEDTRWLAGLSHQGGIAQVLRSRHVLALGTVVSLLARLARVYRRQSTDVVHVNWLQNALPLWGTRTPALITVAIRN